MTKHVRVLITIMFPLLYVMTEVVVGSFPMSVGIISIALLSALTTLLYTDFSSKRSIITCLTSLFAISVLSILMLNEVTSLHTDVFLLFSMYISFTLVISISYLKRDKTISYLTVGLFLVLYVTLNLLIMNFESVIGFLLFLSIVILYGLYLSCGSLLGQLKQK